MIQTSDLILSIWPHKAITETKWVQIRVNLLESMNNLNWLRFLPKSFSFYQKRENINK
jgi:hypothetical protein